jgi:hypothetical protein
MPRFDYLPFKNGKMQDAGGYREDSDRATGLHKAQQEAFMLCGLYTYDHVSILAGQSVLCVVHKDGSITDRTDFGKA